MWLEFQKRGERECMGEVIYEEMMVEISRNRFFRYEKFREF